MEILTLIILILGIFKLVKMNDELTSMGRKLDSLKYSLNNMPNGVQKEAQEIKLAPKPELKPLKLEIIKEKKFKIKTEPSVFEKLQKRFGNKSLEDFLIGNLLLNVSIVAFVLGVGFFLKYSIDQNWIPIWGRILIGITIAIAMLFGGIKTFQNSHKLFSEGLFGGGIAILYLSIFAGFALDGFAFLSLGVAFGAMIAITLLSGLIAVRYNSMTTAVFGLIGGFVTPFLINSGSNNIEGLMIYILILNLGVLYIAISKKWSLLNWLAFGFTALIEIGTVLQSSELFYFLLAMYFVLFIIYSIVPFINELREKNLTLTPPLVILFGANLLLFLGVSAKLFLSYGIEFKYFSIITTFIASYLLLYVYYLKQKGEFAQNLLFTILAQALGLLLLTPAILFEGEILSAVWAIESVILLWIAQKTGQKSFLWFGLIGLTLSFFRYLGINITDIYYLQNEQTYFQDLIKQTITAILVIGAFFISFKLKLNDSLQIETKKYYAKELMIGGGVFLLFAFLNAEVANWAKLFFPKAQQISVTLLWVLFGIIMFVISLRQNIVQGKNIAMVLISVAILKAFFIDLADADALYRIILFMVVGVLLFVLAYYYKGISNNR